MRTVNQLTDLKGKRVLMRVDFDVPVEHGVIAEDFRIKKQKATIDWLDGQGAYIVLVGHISAVPSFGGLIPQLHILLSREINFIKDIESIPGYLDQYSEVGLLENIRSWEGEEANDGVFAKKLGEHFDMYVNNAFAVSHRNHASVSAIAQVLPAYAGLQLQEEVAHLQAALDAPGAGKVVIIGGAKASTKVPVIKYFLDKVEHILVGGVVANDILKARGQDIGTSLVDDDSEKVLEGMDVHDSRIVVPTDFVMHEGRILDIGARSIGAYEDIIKQASYIIWNGPMGLFEEDQFANGTHAVAKAVAQRSNISTVIGGGDTIAAVNQLGILDQYSFVSTGGGAMLEFLAGKELPGIKIIQ